MGGSCRKVPVTAAFPREYLNFYTENMREIYSHCIYLVKRVLYSLVWYLEDAKTRRFGSRGTLLIFLSGTFFKNLTPKTLVFNTILRRRRRIPTCSTVTWWRRFHRNNVKSVDHRVQYAAAVLARRTFDLFAICSSYWCQSLTPNL